MSSDENEFSFEAPADCAESSHPRTSEVSGALPNDAEETTATVGPEYSAPNELDGTPRAGAGASLPAVLFLKDNDVALRYSVSRPTIWRWVKLKDGFPAPIKIAEGTTRWLLKDLEEFEDKRSSAALNFTMLRAYEGEGH